MDANRIRHTVAFALVHAAGSEEERDFLDAAGRLAAIPGVEAFELLAEVSPKNDYRFGISMEFADRGAYEHYNEPSGSRAVRAGTLGTRGAGLPRSRLRVALAASSDAASRSRLRRPSVGR